MVKWIVVMTIQPSICLDDWGKPRKNPSQVGRIRDSNPGPPESESRALPRSHLARLQGYCLSPILLNIYVSSECSAQGQVFHCKRRNLGVQFCRMQVFHRKLRNQGCSFTRDWIGAVASCCFPHPTLSLASEQTLQDLKDPKGTNVEVRRVDLANWARRTSPKFTAGVKYNFHQGFWPDHRSRNPNHPSPPLSCDDASDVFDQHPC